MHERQVQPFYFCSAETSSRADKIVAAGSWGRNRVSTTCERWRPWPLGGALSGNTSLSCACQLNLIPTNIPRRLTQEIMTVFFKGKDVIFLNIRCLNGTVFGGFISFSPIIFRIFNRTHLCLSTSILVRRTRWRSPPSSAGAALYIWAARWRRPAWCTSGTPACGRFGWSSRYPTLHHHPPGERCTDRAEWSVECGDESTLVLGKRKAGEAGDGGRLFFLPPGLTFALNSAKKSKCFLRSVARMASITKKRKRLNSTCSRFTRKLYSGRDMKRFHAEAAWWFSKTERSLYRRAYSVRGQREERRVSSSAVRLIKFTHNFI